MPDPVFSFRASLSGQAGIVEVGFTDGRLDVGDLASRAVRDAGVAAIAEATGATPRLMSQVHGTEVAVVEDEEGEEPPRADALVTDRPGVALLARSADCVPVLLADADGGLIAAVHAGRSGVAAGVVPAAVAALRRRGAGPLTAWVGPHVCGRCYEVPAELREEVAARVPETWAVTGQGTPALDLGAGVRAQLVEAGCTVVDDAVRCTLEDPELHSHRRDAARAGRQAGVVWRHP